MTPAVTIGPPRNAAETAEAWRLLTGEAGANRPQTDSLFVAKTAAGGVVGAAVGILNEDGVLWVWPAVGPDASARVKLLEAVCATGFGHGARLAQTLLEDVTDEVRADLTAAAFRPIATIAFLERPPGPVDAVPGPGVAETFRVGRDEGRLERLVAETYRDSRDCESLGEARSAADAIRGHRQVGRFDPSWWSIYTVDGDDAGVLLASPMGSGGDENRDVGLEITYVGVAPPSRRTGLASQMLADAVARSETHRLGTIRVAVDTANTPAFALYHRFGFASVGAREAFVCDRR
ncbi:MAG: GNAT family N-acetyltransferase [Planctomycetota bacterium]